jgi:hypothetical protein
VILPPLVFPDTDDCEVQIVVTAISKIMNEIASLNDATRLCKLDLSNRKPF